MDFRYIHARTNHQTITSETRLQMKSIRTILYFTGALTIGIAATSGSAQASGVRLGINIGVPAPVYVAPTPYYVPPPPPVVYAPAPYYGRPPVVIGWYGNRYYDGRRYWGRDEWYRRHGGYNRGHGGYGHGYGHHR
jgi:hypothetical protein